MYFINLKYLNNRMSCVNLCSVNPDQIAEGQVSCADPGIFVRGGPGQAD